MINITKTSVDRLAVLAKQYTESYNNFETKKSAYCIADNFKSMMSAMNDLKYAHEIFEEAHIQLTHQLTWVNSASYRQWKKDDYSTLSINTIVSLLQIDIHLTETNIDKLNSILDRGLKQGKGNDKNSTVCLEQAIALAMGEELTDHPTCVGNVVNAYGIAINDANWSSNSARSKGLHDFAIAQIGSNTLNQQELAEKLAILTVNTLLVELFIELKIGDETLHNQLKNANTLEMARTAAYAAGVTARAARAAPYAGVTARAGDDDCAESAAFAAVFHGNTINYVAYAAGYAASATNGDKYLILSAKLAVDVLKEMGSPGCAFL